MYSITEPGIKKKMDCYIYLSARTPFAGLNLSFFSATEKERWSEGRASGRNALGGAVGGHAHLTSGEKAGALDREQISSS